MPAYLPNHNQQTLKADHLTQLFTSDLDTIVIKDREKKESNHADFFSFLPLGMRTSQYRNKDAAMLNTM